MISDRLRPFGTTIFAEMTALAEAHGAINLSQGFPDFEGPAAVVDAAIASLRAGENQYARSRGDPRLVTAVAESRRRWYGMEFDPETEVGVFSGATEALAASFLGLLNPGDEAILFEPVYDSYPAGVALAGAVPRYLPLSFPDFRLDAEKLAALVTDRTRLIVLNSPHNPSGKVFDRNELDAIARVAIGNDLLVIADEVYEKLVFDDAAHVPIASFPGMRERTLSISSAGKTFSFTGFKIGWATGPAALIDAAQAAHQFLVFAVPRPLQAAAAWALTELGDDYFAEYRAAYSERRDYLVGALRAAGFAVKAPAGTYFVIADFSALFDGDDRAFARFLIEEHGVAAIPPSPFYPLHPDEGRRLVRFAFCKRMETLERAAERLGRIRR